jgi:hypothetical protein
MAPTKDQIQAAVDAFRVDAQMWQSMGDELREAARVAFRLDLGNLQFSYLGEMAGLTEAYSDIQSALVGLLNDGGQAFDDIAAALRKAADGYEEDERNAVHRFRGIY